VLKNGASGWTIHDEEDEDEGYEGSDSSASADAFALDLSALSRPADRRTSDPAPLTPLLIPGASSTDVDMDDDTPTHTPHALAPGRPRTLASLLPLARPRRPPLYASASAASTSSSSSASTASAAASAAASPVTPTSRAFVFPLPRPITNAIRRTTSFTLPPALTRVTSRTSRARGVRSVQPSPTRDAGRSRTRRAADSDDEDGTEDARGSKSNTPRKKRKLLRL
jgi:hypothetical protein